MADASYPDDLLYHPEHDWARIDGDVATFGITWYAQDALGEVVFFDPPEVGSTVTAGESYAEVESVKAVSDVIAPLSGEIVEVNDRAGRRRRRRSTTTPTATAGWSRSSSPIPAEKDGLLDQAAYTASPVLSRYTAVTDDDLRAMLDAIGVGSVEELFDAPDPRRRAPRPRARPPGRDGRAGRLRAPARPRRAQHVGRGRAHVPRRRHVRPLRPGAHRHADVRARSS